MSEEHQVEHDPEPDRPDRSDDAETVPEPSDEPVAAGGGRTGDAAVDTTLSTLERLDQLSVEEHLPLFEQAHEALRRALDRPPEAAGSGS